MIRFNHGRHGVPALTFIILLLAGLIRASADEAALPTGPFEASHYRLLWETSPFAVASPVAVESVQYALVGAAQFEGISYASVVDKQSPTQEHFVITSKEPSHGMSLVSLVHGSTPGSTYATLQQSGGSILRLNLETAATPGMSSPPAGEVSTATPANANPTPTYIIPRNHPRMRSARIFQPPVFVPEPPPAGSNSP